MGLLKHKSYNITKQYSDFIPHRKSHYATNFYYEEISTKKST